MNTRRMKILRVFFIYKLLKIVCIDFPNRPWYTVLALRATEC